MILNGSGEKKLERVIETKKQGAEKQEEEKQTKMVSWDVNQQEFQRKKW